MIAWARADGVEAARGSPREPEFTADTSYKIDACLSAAAQAKKNRYQHKMGPKPEQPSPEVPRSAFGARTRCGDACDAWARPPRTQPPHDCSAAAQTALRRCPTRPRAARRGRYASARHRLQSARPTPGVQRRSGPVLT